MKSKKITIIAILAMALVMMMACGLVANVTSIDFTNAPKAFYEVGEDAYAKDLRVKIVMNDNTELDINLTDSRLTVEGIVDGKLDTTTPGTKTLKVTYMGISITATYVVGMDSVGMLWSDNRIVEGDGKTLLADIANGSFSKTEYDLAGYQWDAPVIDGAVTLTPANQVVIKNLTMTTANAFEKAGGFIASVNGDVNISNIKFENVKISNIDNGRYENAKNYGIVVGMVTKSGATVEISDIVVDGATMLGNGRVAGIIGQAGNSVASTTITNCTINNASISGNNPVKDINGDGEADKLGAIMGQLQGGNLTITGCTVTNTTINGTRCLGGLVGYIAVNTGKKVSITNNTLTTVSVLANVQGGMQFESKGYRNIGGIVGTLADGAKVGTVDGTVEIKNNTLDVLVTGDATYASVTSAHKYVGGFRLSGSNGTYNINEVVYRLFEEGATFDQTAYNANHKTVIEALNAALAA